MDKLANGDELSPAIEFLEAGEYTEAQNWLTNFIEAHPDNPEWFNNNKQISQHDNYMLQKDRKIGIACANFTSFEPTEDADRVLAATALLEGPT